MEWWISPFPSNGIGSPFALVEWWISPFPSNGIGSPVALVPRSCCGDQAPWICLLCVRERSAEVQGRRWRRTGSGCLPVAMTAASPALVPVLADHDEDDDFGDFVFASSVLSINPRQPAPPTTVSSYSASFPLFTFDPVPPPDVTPASPKPRVDVDGKWQKPSGPLPLSLFGRDDEEVARKGSSISLDPPLTASSGFFGSSSVASSNNGQAFPPTDDLKDLIAGLYVQQEIIHPCAPETGSTDNLKNDSDFRSSSDRTHQGVDGEDDFDKSCWEFKDAFSASTGGELVHYLWAKKDDNSADISQLDQVKAAVHGSLFQACSTSILKAEVPEVEVILEAKPIAKILSVDLQQERACILSHTSANGFSNGYGSTSSSRPENEPSSIEIGFKPNINGQYTGIANNVLESKDPFAKIETINSFPATKSHSQTENLEDVFVSSWSGKRVDDGRKGFNDDESVFNPSDLISTVNGDTLNTYPAFPGKTAGDETLMISTVSQEALNSTYAKNTCLHNEKIENTDFVSKSTVTHDKNSLKPMVLLDFYARLKEKSRALGLHHIENLKRRKNSEAVTDEEPKLLASDDEIKVAFTKLGISDPNVKRMEKSSEDEISVNELLDFPKDSCLYAFNIEYHLSEKISSAEKDLSSAMWIFEHSSSIIDILVRSSLVEQRCYISLWSKMASVCDAELNHGATIWTQAVSSNVQMELLHIYQGQQYILALGEIYRVVEILSAALRLYKPWILVNTGASEELLCKIRKSAEVWKDSGLKHALELISSARIQLKVLADELIESINSISMLNEETMQKCISCPDVQLCRLSLLPLDLLPDIALVVWEDNLYFCKVANLWVNRISLGLVSGKDRVK